MPGSGWHEIFAARGLVSRPLTPSDYVRVTRVLAAAPLLPRRSGPTQRSGSRVRRRRLQRTASKHAYAAHHVTHHERLLMLDAAKGYLRQRLAQGRRQEEPAVARLEDETAFSALLRTPMNWLGVCRNNVASSIGLSGRLVRFSATMPVRNPSLTAARSNSCVRTAACNYLNRMAQSSCLSFLMLPCARSSAR